MNMENQYLFCKTFKVEYNHISFEYERQIKHVRNTLESDILQKSFKWKLFLRREIR